MVREQRRKDQINVRENDIYEASGSKYGQQSSGAKLASGTRLLAQDLLKEDLKGHYRDQGVSKELKVAKSLIESDDTFGSFVRDFSFKPKFENYRKH